MKSLTNYIYENNFHKSEISERLIINKDYKDGIQFDKGIVILITEYHRKSFNEIVLEFDYFENKIKECNNNKFEVKKNKLLKSFGIYNNDEKVELKRIDDTVLYSYENTVNYERNIFVIHEDNEHIYKFLESCLEKKYNNILHNIFFSADEILNELHIDDKYMKISNNDNTKKTIQMTYNTIVINRVIRKLTTNETIV